MEEREWVRAYTSKADTQWPHHHSPPSPLTQQVSTHLIQHFSPSSFLLFTYISPPGHINSPNAPSSIADGNPSSLPPINFLDDKKEGIFPPTSIPTSSSNAKLLSPTSVQPPSLPDCESTMCIYVYHETHLTLSIHVPPSPPSSLLPALPPSPLSG